MPRMRWSLVAAVGLASLAATGASAAATQASSRLGGPCAKPDALLEVGEAKAARAEYVKVLKLFPNSRCARRGFAALATPAETKKQSNQKRCNRASDLARAGEKEEAKKIYVTLLGEGPVACARAGLRALPRQGFTDRWSDRFRTVGTLITTFVLPGFLAFLLLTLLLGGLTWWRRFRWAGRHVPLLGIPLRPRLAVGDVKEGDAANVAAFARAGLSKMRREIEGGREYALGPVAGTEGLDKKVGKLAEVSPQFNVLSSIIGFGLSVARLPRYTLVVTMQSAGDGETKVHGVTVGLEDQGTVAATETLWAPATTADSSDIEYLGFAAAAWADFLVRRRENLPPPRFTSVARSYGFLRAGVELQARGDRNRAYNAYRNAIVIDPDNVGALVNLSMLFTAPNEDLSRAIELLDQAFVTLGGAPSAVDRVAGPFSRENRPEWYQVLFNRAATWAHLADTQASDPEAQAQSRLRAMNDALLAAGTAATTLVDRGRNDPRKFSTPFRWRFRAKGREKRDLVRFLLDFLEPSALLMLAGLILQTTPRVRGRAVGSIGDRRQLVKILATLPATASDNVVERLYEYCRPYSDRSAFISYNLACFCAVQWVERRTPGARDQAFRYLEHALEIAPPAERRSRARKAAADTTLAPLGDGIAGIVGRYKPLALPPRPIPPAPAALAGGPAKLPPP